MKKALRLAILANFGLLSSIRSFSLPASPLNAMFGRWYSATLEGIGPVSSPKCTAVTDSQRHLTLTKSDTTNGVTGEWARVTTSIWIHSENGTCKWQDNDTAFAPLYGASWSYKVSGTLDPVHNVIDLSGTFDHCEGKGCGKLMTKVITSPFHTQLSLVSGQLVDTGPDHPTSDIRFVRVSEQVDATNEADSALSDFLKDFDQGNFGHVYDTALSDSFKASTSKEMFTLGNKEWTAKVGLTVSRTLLFEQYLNYVPNIATLPGVYVYVVNQVSSASKQSGVEFLLLIKEGAGWRLAWINYGS